MRSGTRTHSKRRWTPSRHRPVCRIRPGYQFCYLYAAIAPASGELIALILPEMTRVCFEVFVEHFRRQTKRLHGNHPVVLIGDKAGSHQSEVCTQRGIAFEPLLTACPELNPVERFFEELRKQLSNRIFDNIKEVEGFLSKILKKYWPHPQTLIQLCRYPYANYLIENGLTHPGLTERCINHNGCCTKEENYRYSFSSPRKLLCSWSVSSGTSYRSSSISHIFWMGL